jgi:AhpD family alkylhydroperoxidase
MNLNPRVISASALDIYPREILMSDQAGKGHHHLVQEELAGPYRDLQGLIPDVLAGYAGLGNAAMGEGQLSAKVKELIALAIAITRECDGCIVAHVRGVIRRGASAEEVAEMIGVTILMNGGPATVWGPRALEAYREYAAT